RRVALCACARRADETKARSISIQSIRSRRHHASVHEPARAQRCRATRCDRNARKFAAAEAKPTFARHKLAAIPRTPIAARSLAGGSELPGIHRDIHRESTEVLCELS